VLLYIDFRVPLGFICGFPLKSSGGEMYGGSMFTRSAAGDTLQGQAIQSVNEKWGDDFLQRSGRETIGIPVCKKKYNPFLFHVVEVKSTTTTTIPNESSSETLLSPRKDQQQQKQQQTKRLEVLVERLYGCRCHHVKRKEVILEHGVRKGWQPYGVWSLRKALEVAKREEIRLNQEISDIGEICVRVDSEDENESLDDNSLLEQASTGLNSSASSSHNSSTVVAKDFNTIRTVYISGNYTYKIQSAYDNIFKEMHGYSESDAEDLREEFAKGIASKKGI
jgi:hypothetical protein